MSGGGLKGTRKFPFFKSAVRATTAFSAAAAVPLAPPVAGGSHYLQLHVHQANMLPRRAKKSGIGAASADTALSGGNSAVGSTVRVAPKTVQTMLLLLLLQLLP